jgi:hypothetical protein
MTHRSAEQLDRLDVAAEACVMSVATPTLPVPAERLWAALLAATLMNLPLGSVYAFSVLLRPIACGNHEPQGSTNQAQERAKHER